MCVGGGADRENKGLELLETHAQVLGIRPDGDQQLQRQMAQIVRRKTVDSASTISGRNQVRARANLLARRNQVRRMCKAGPNILRVFGAAGAGEVLGGGGAGGEGRVVGGGGVYSKGLRSKVSRSALPR